MHADGIKPCATAAGGRGCQGRAPVQALRRHVRRQEVRHARPLDERHQRRLPRWQPPRYAGLRMRVLINDGWCETR